MSDFGSSVPPPPPPPPPWGGAPQPQPPSFGPPGAPPPTTAPWSAGPSSWGHGTPGWADAAPARPARPSVTVAALLVLLGGIVVAVGSFVTWFTFLGESFSGFSGGETDTVRDGPFFLTFGLVLAVGGGILLALRRVLGVAIAAVVVAALAVISGFADLGDLLDRRDQVRDLGVELSIGPGLYLCIIGALVALGGAITATAKRRR